MQNINKIIEIFYREPAKVCSINELSKLLESPYGSIYNHTQFLIKEGVLRADIKGKATLCSINYESQKAVELLSQTSTFVKEEFTKIQRVLARALDELVKGIKNKSSYNVFTVVLYGSLVKKSDTKKSDIDLFFISSSKDKYDEMIENECNSTGMSYGRNVNPIIAEPNMYINMLKEKDENVGKQILQNKVIFYGANKYWELTMEALREKG